jgi:hypothetical protein
MLIQEAEVRSSTGSTFVCTDTTIWQALQVRLNATQVRSNLALHYVLSGTCARTQMCDKHSQVRECSGIGGSAFDRKDYV